jgi:hypothetical protein
MQTFRVGRWRLRGVVFTLAVLLTGAHLAGCGGASKPIDESSGATRAETPRTSGPMTPTSAVANEWIEMIEDAGMPEYAQLGRELLEQGRVRIVSPPTLEWRFNAFAHINTRQVWINTPMFERYPDMLDHATIFLHELIHIRSGEITHNGPWWSTQSEFRVYYRDLETSALALDTTALHDASIGVGP